MNRRELRAYSVALALSTVVKVALSFVNFVYGFRQGNFKLIEPDGNGYVVEAARGFVNTDLGQHWVYRWLNVTMLEWTGDVGSLYLQMSLFNVLVSGLLPVVAFPIIAKITGGSVPWRTRAFIVFTWISLFWPSSLWLATQNLKDVLAALLTLSFLSALLVRKSPWKRIAGAILALTCVLLLVGLRQYMPFILIGGAAHFLIRTVPWRTAWPIVLVGVFILIPILSPLVATALDPETSWLTNAEVRRELNEELLEGGGTATSVSSSPSALLVGLIRAILNPFPTVNVSSGYSALVVLRTVFILFTSTVVFRHVLLRDWEGKSLVVGSVVAGLAFSAVFPGVVGPRHAFSMFDLPFLMIFSVVAAETRTFNQWATSVGFGLLATIGFVLITARGFL